MTEERLEKVRKLREMKKFGKKVQIEVQQKREKEKRDMLEEVKYIFSLAVHDNECHQFLKYLMLKFTQQELFLNN